MTNIDDSVPNFIFQPRQKVFGLRTESESEKNYLVMIGCMKSRNDDDRGEVIVEELTIR